MWKKHKTGESLMGSIFLIILLILSFAFIDGVIWLGDKILPTLFTISYWIFAIIILIFTPLAIYRKTRAIAGNGMIISSWIFAVTLWFMCFLVTHSYWGAMGVYIGLFLLGIGIIPIAMLSDLIKGNWAALLELVFLAGLTVGCRLFGSDLKESYAAFRAAQSQGSSPDAQHTKSSKTGIGTEEDDKKSIDNDEKSLHEPEENNRCGTQIMELENEEIRYARVLGLEGDITPANVKQAYREMVNKYHPDKMDELGDEFKSIAYKKTHEIIAAYDYFCRKFEIA